MSVSRCKFVLRCYPYYAYICFSKGRKRQCQVQTQEKPHNRSSLVSPAAFGEPYNEGQEVVMRLTSNNNFT